MFRFQGFWDDRDSEYGKLYHLEIMYFLADDTIEIKQKLGCDESTDIKKIFLRRTPLPKVFNKVFDNCINFVKRERRQFRYPADL